jgi:hypothetical protein
MKRIRIENSGSSASARGRSRYIGKGSGWLLTIPYPNAPNRGVTHDPVKLAAYKAQEASRKEGQRDIWRKQPKAEIVMILKATHYVFLSDEAQVLLLITRFIDGLPRY